MKQERKEQTSAIVQLARKYGMEETKLVETLRATVIKSKKIRGRDGKPDTWVPASVEEVNAGLMVAAHYDLDPLLKQIHFFPAEGGGIVPIVGYDGWVKLVNREKRFAGVDFVDHIDEKNILYAITCTMLIWNSPTGDPALGSHPVATTEYLEECKRDTEPWKKWPRRMLRNKAYIQAARMAFGHSGIYDEDEGARIIEAGEAIDVTPVLMPKAIERTASPTTAGPLKAENTEKTVEPNKPTATTEPATATDAPKTDAEKKAYILSIATRAAEVFGVSVAQVIFDLSKFKDKEDPNKEVGAQGIDDPRLVGRWLNKTYGEAKKLEEQLATNGPF